MGKKQKQPSLGRSLIKDKSSKRNSSKTSLRHASELQDGQDYNRINFQSITEQSDVDSFLSTAELAGTDFKAERLNIKFVRPSSFEGILTKEEKCKIKLIQDRHQDFLRIPRRPPWDRLMSAEQLAEAERESFLQWRRNLVELEQKEGIVMTPYEKNIEIWRQLWRVIERSDVVVQIVDARNPLLFRSEDLSQYIKEVSSHKENLLLVNKADFLTETQREIWVKYFTKVGIQAVFFCATAEATLENIEENNTPDLSDILEEEIKENIQHLNLRNEESSDIEVCIHECQKDLDDLAGRQNQTSIPETDYDGDNIVSSNYTNNSKLLNRQELVDIFKNFHLGPKVNPSYVTVGLVGYPNVGKSSTINSLLQVKKVAVSATPGKTKHFQTLFLSDDLLLCDCPGLVFPAFVCTKEEMIISGILSIDQMRNHVPPMNLVLSQIPRQVLESKYGVKIPAPLEGEDPDRSPTSEEFLSVYGYMRGFMTPRGIPDHPRSSRYILKDYVNGQLLYCHCPPGEKQEEYHQSTVDKVRKSTLQATPHQMSALPRKKQSAAIDASFFNQSSSTAHFKGRQHTVYNSANATTNSEVAVKKPWRLISKRNTREKARRKYAHLDQ